MSVLEIIFLVVVILFLVDVIGPEITTTTEASKYIMLYKCKCFTGFPLNILSPRLLCSDGPTSNFCCWYHDTARGSYLVLIKYVETLMQGK